jgi:hypothetical protein
MLTLIFFCKNAINDLLRNVLFCEKLNIFVIFVYFRLKIFAKTKINFRKNFRENAKTKIFVSTLL